MSIIDKVLVGLSVFDCVLSVVAVHLVRQGLKKRQRVIAYKTALASAYEQSRVEVSAQDILQAITKLKLAESDGHQQIVQVKGIRKSPIAKSELAELNGRPQVTRVRRTRKRKNIKADIA